MSLSGRECVCIYDSASEETDCVQPYRLDKYSDNLASCTAGMEISHHISVSNYRNQVLVLTLLPREN
jgi:hypothetical protein